MGPADRRRRTSVAHGILSAIALLLIGQPGAAPLQAGQVRPVNLEEMTQRADRIFSGRCVAVQTIVDRDRGLPIARVTFDVDRAIKGAIGRRITVNVVAGVPAPGLAALDVPRFAPGEEVVLFLYPDSALSLTSPVGLGQGKFSVAHDKRGRALAVNALGNRQLLRGLSAGARAHVDSGLLQWDGRPGLPAGSLLDAAQQLARLSDAGQPPGESPRGAEGGRP